MKGSFPGYYQPTGENLSQIWDDCIFVLDANILLNLYRYSPATRQQLIDILKGVAQRLWVPHQAALEYQRNRPTIIAEQTLHYDKIEQKLDSAISSLENELGAAKHLLDTVKKNFARAKKDLAKQKRSVPDWWQHDTIRETLDDLLSGRIGPSYDSTQLKAIYEEGKQRYIAKKPPGYEDDNKPGDEKYGDLVLWKQVIDKGRETQKPVVLVTEDTKGDWWSSVRGKTVGPKPELIEEMLQQAGVEFYMYRADRFMHYAQQYLRSRVDQKAIEEVAEVGRHDKEAVGREVPELVWERPTSTTAAEWSQIGEQLRQLYQAYEALGRDPAVAQLAQSLRDAGEKMNEVAAPLAESLQRMRDAIDAGALKDVAGVPPPAKLSEKASQPNREREQ